MELEYSPRLCDCQYLEKRCKQLKPPIPYPHKNDEYIFGNSALIKNRPCIRLKGHTRKVKRNYIPLLDTHSANGYNIFCAEVAQSVEQRTENPRVPSSILGLGTKLKAEVAQW